MDEHLATVHKEARACQERALYSGYDEAESDDAARRARKKMEVRPARVTSTALSIVTI